MAISAWIKTYIDVFVCFVRLLEVGRNLNKADTEGLKQCAYYFKQLDQVDQKFRSKVHECGSQCPKLPALEGQWFITFKPSVTTNTTTRARGVPPGTRAITVARVLTVASKNTVSKSLMTPTMSTTITMPHSPSDHNGYKTHDSLNCLRHDSSTWHFVPSKLFLIFIKLHSDDCKSSISASSNGNIFLSLQHGYATEMYLKIGDIKALLELHVETKHWDEVWRYIASCSVTIKT